jgi:hypothetical protein
MKKSYAISAMLGVSCAATEPETELQALESPDQTSSADESSSAPANHGATGPSSIVRPIVSNMVEIGSSEQRTLVNLPPLLQGASSQPILVSYEEVAGASEPGVNVSLWLQDESGQLLSLGTGLVLDETWDISTDGGPVSFRTSQGIQQLAGGTMRASKVDDELRFDISGATIGEGTPAIEGHIQGVPGEWCIRLVEPTDGRIVGPVGSKPLQREVDETWSSPFCAGVTRLFGD